MPNEMPRFVRGTVELDPRTELYALMELLDRANVPGGSVHERVQVLLADLDRLEKRAEAEAKKTSREKLLAALDEDRWETVALLRDACLDEGRYDEAAAWGWVAEMRKWPVRTKDGRWIWRYSHAEGHVPTSFDLPPGLAILISMPNPPRTVREALQAVVDVIVAKKWKPGEK